MLSILLDYSIYINIYKILKFYLQQHIILDESFGVILLK
jgi:hypothetical protein